MRIIIILTLFLQILTINYDLVSDEEKTIQSLNSSETYSLYINAVQYQRFNISFTMNYMNTTPFTFLYIKEYSNRASSNFLKSTYISIPILDYNNKLKSSFTYLVNKSDTQYIALQFTPNYNINYIVVNINVEKCAYDLSSGVAKNITNLKSGIPYYFFISSFQFQTNSINLNMNFMNNTPFTYYYIYEYSRRSSSNILKSTYISIPNLYSNNELTLSFKYLVNNYDTQYIALQFTPNYNINYIILNISTEGGAYDLSNGIDKNITNLKSGIRYYFFIPSTQFQIDSIKLIISPINSNILSYIYEYPSRSSSIFLNQIRKNRWY